MSKGENYLACLRWLARSTTVSKLGRTGARLVHVICSVDDSRSAFLSQMSGDRVGQPRRPMAFVHFQDLAVVGTNKSTLLSCQQQSNHPVAPSQ